MLKFLARRIALTVPTFFGLMLVTFIVIRLVPGDPVEIRTGERNIAPERLAQLQHEMGLDQPLLKQFADYVWQLLHADFGTSVVSNEKVLHQFLTLFPATVELGLCAVVFAVLIGLPFGVVAAVKRGSIFDHALIGTSVVAQSMPSFWWGIMLIMFFSERLGWTPVSGRIDLVSYYLEPVTGFMLVDSLISGDKGAFVSALSHLVLPALVLATGPLAIIARMTRSSMLEVLGEDYVRTAKAKGLGFLRVVGIHALRNAMIPVVTVIGLSVSSIFSGAVITETIFSWPGVGKWLIDSINQRDYPSFQGGVMLISAIVISVNLLVDFLYSVINPRIRHGR